MTTRMTYILFFWKNGLNWSYILCKIPFKYIWAKVKARSITIIFYIKIDYIVVLQIFLKSSIIKDWVRALFNFEWVFNNPYFQFINFLVRRSKPKKDRQTERKKKEINKGRHVLRWNCEKPKLFPTFYPKLILNSHFYCFCSFSLFKKKF